MQIWCWGFLSQIWCRLLLRFSILFIIRIYTYCRFDVEDFYFKFDVEDCWFFFILFILRIYSADLMLKISISNLMYMTFFLNYLIKGYFRMSDLLHLAFTLLAWNDITITVFFLLFPFKQHAREKKKEGEERNSYFHRSIREKEILEKLCVNYFFGRFSSYSLYRPQPSPSI